MTEVTLTPKQHHVKLVIARFHRKYGYYPSIRELSEKTGKSMTQCARYMNALVKRGAAEKTAGIAHGFRLL
jgi:sulfur relay (sulfurtransferase) DsrC/TusE family protein